MNILKNPIMMSLSTRGGAQAKESSHQRLVSTGDISILLIDNYDSFTFNIKHVLEALGYRITILKNDDPTLLSMNLLAFSHLILSPGPGAPRDSGHCMVVIQRYYPKMPILGICLGHQCLAEFFGAQIVHAKRVCHGKISRMKTTRQSIFASLPEEFTVVRYHSLAIAKATLPNSLQVLACSTEHGDFDEIMAIQHQNLPIWGVQYHPEAAMTEYGAELLQNFVSMTEG